MGTGTTGTGVWNVLLLDQYFPRCRIDLGPSSLAQLSESLAANTPPIVFVATRHLEYWHRDTLHTILVVEITSGMVLVNDPAFPTAPQTIPLHQFIAAWSEVDFLTLLVHVTPETVR